MGTYQLEKQKEKQNLSWRHIPAREAVQLLTPFWFITLDMNKTVGSVLSSPYGIKYLFTLQFQMTEGQERPAIHN